MHKNRLKIEQYFGQKSSILYVEAPESRLLVRKKTSVRLRGRSFYLQLLEDALINKILVGLDLSVVSMLYSGAGNFVILAPNTTDIREKLSKLTREITETLEEGLTGTISISLAKIACSDTELENIGDTLSALALQISRAKYSTLDPILSDESGSWLPEKVEDFFSPNLDDFNTKYCSGCSRSEKNILRDLCSYCNEQTELGKELSEAKYIYRTSSEAKPLAKSIKIFDSCYKLLENATDLSKAKHSDTVDSSLTVIETPNTDVHAFQATLKQLDCNMGISFQYFGTLIPKVKKSQPLTFYELSQLSEGKDMLGILKADVDNLGLFFSYGEVTKGKGLSIFSSKDISNRLDTFFTGYIQQIGESEEFCFWKKPCINHQGNFIPKEIKKSQKDESNDEAKMKSKKKRIMLFYPKLNSKKDVPCTSCNKNGKTTAIYSIFSGGDDLALVGPWHLIVQFAKKLNEEFSDFIANNPYLGISAGITLNHYHDPISHSLKLTESQLETSKSLLKVRSMENKLVSIKNSISVFDETVLWSNKVSTALSTNKTGMKFGNFEELYKFGENLYSILENKSSKLGRSFYQLLLQLWDDTFGSFSRTKLQCQRGKTTYYPLLAYHLMRRIRDKEKVNRYFNEWKELMPWIKIPVSWALYKQKVKTNEL